MKHLEWQVFLTHEKCGCDASIRTLSATAAGLLIFECFCWDCNDEFRIERSCFQIAFDAAENDRDFAPALAYHFRQKPPQLPN